MKRSKSIVDSVPERLKDFSKKIKIRFKNLKYLEEALIHSSFSHEQSNRIPSNERLEYLGDSVLGLIVNEYLFKYYQEYDEGELAKIKSYVVSENSLAILAKAINLGKYIIFSKGEEQSGGRFRESILADAFEAVLAAIYLDQGLPKTRDFVLELIMPIIRKADRIEYKKDYKSSLQEIIQKKMGSVPEYRIVKETGPDHHKKFTAKVYIQDEEFGVGLGATKKKAEQNAAKYALERRLNVQSKPLQSGSS